MGADPKGKHSILRRLRCALDEIYGERLCLVHARVAITDYDAAVSCPFVVAISDTTCRRIRATGARDDLFVRRSDRGASDGGGGAMPAFCSMSFSMSISILVARKSAPADLLTSWAMTASRLVILRHRPFVVTTTDSFSASARSTGSASARSAGRFFALRPRGLPDWP
jgi:hypothetical protein